MKRKRILLKKSDKIFSTQLIIVEDDYLLQLIEVYPFKDIKKYIKVPNSLYPMLLELDKQFHSEENVQNPVISISNTLAQAKLQVGYTPAELSKYHIQDGKSLELLHHKLNEVKPKLQEQVYCSDNKTHEFGWVVKRNERSQLDILANEIRSIFQNNTNLRQYAY